MMVDTIHRLARGFAAEWLRPSDPDHATPAMVDTLSTAMLAFYSVARGVEQRAAALDAAPSSDPPLLHETTALHVLPCQLAL